MDMSNLWNDDPEELLLDLGFGCDEPDLSGRIPARFINYQSQAKGINLQVFLDAQKTRVDLENPDVSNRFRQVEVLQQVSTAFSSLVGSSCPAGASSGNIPPEARERKRRIVALFRQASKKAKRQINDKDSDSVNIARPAVESQHTPKDIEKSVLIMNPADKTQGLTPVVEEDELHPQPEHQACDTQWRKLKSESLWDGQTSGSVSLQRGKSLAQESFEIEEIQSFDEGGIPWVNSGAADHIMRRMMRTSSCQSDSSGFLEEPVIPSLSQQLTPGAHLIKALSGLSGGSTDSQSSDVPCCWSQNSRPPVLPSTFTASVPEELFHPPESPSVARSPLLVFSCHAKSDFSMSELDTPLSQPPAPLSLVSFPPPSLFKSHTVSDVLDHKSSPRSSSVVAEQCSLKKDFSSPALDVTFQNKKSDHFFASRETTTPPPKDNSPSYATSPTNEVFLDDREDFSVKNTDHKITLSDGQRIFKDSMLGADESSEAPCFDPQPLSQGSWFWSTQLIDAKRASDPTNLPPHTDEDLEDDVFHPSTDWTVPRSQWSEGVNEKFDFKNESSLQNTEAIHCSVKPYDDPGEAEVSTLHQENSTSPFDSREIPADDSKLSQLADQNAEKHSEQTVSQRDRTGNNLEHDAPHVFLKHTPGDCMFRRSLTSDAKSDKDADDEDCNLTNDPEDDVLNTAKNIIVLECAEGTNLDPNQKVHRTLQSRHTASKRPSEPTHFSSSPVEEDHVNHLVKDDFPSAADGTITDDSFHMNHQSEDEGDSGFQTFAEEKESQVQKTLIPVKTFQETTKKSQQTNSPTALQEHYYAFEAPTPSPQQSHPAAARLPEPTLPSISHDESLDHLDELVEDDVTAKTNLIDESFSGSQRPEENDRKDLVEKETRVEHFENPAEILNSQEKKDAKPQSQEPYGAYKSTEASTSSPQLSPPADERLVEPTHCSVSQCDHSHTEEDHTIQNDFRSSVDPSITDDSYHKSKMSEGGSERDFDLQDSDCSNERREAKETKQRNWDSPKKDNTDDIDESAQLIEVATEGLSKPTRRSSSGNNKYDHMDYLVQEEFHTTIDHSFMDNLYQGNHESKDIEVKSITMDRREEEDNMGMDKSNSPTSNQGPRPEPSSPQQTIPVGKLTSSPEMIGKTPSSSAHHSEHECPHTEDDNSSYLEQDALQVRKVGDFTDDKSISEVSAAQLISEEIYYETAHSIDEPAHERDQGERGSSVLGGKVSALIEIEALEQVFETSVDGSEGEHGYTDFYFQQLDTERRVYWAEPIMVSDLTSLSGRSDSDENLSDDLDLFPTHDPPSLLTRNTSMTIQEPSSESSSKSPPHFTSIDPKPRQHYISVQMPSSSSSHIVHRKDVPFVTDSKCSLRPLTLPLDTSTPFRAVQSWTDLRIQQTFSNGHLHSTPNVYTVPLKSMRGNYQTASYSVDRLCLDEEDRSGGEDEKKYWEARGAVLPEHQYSCSVRKDNRGHDCPGVVFYSLDELEEMILCLQQFRSVLTSMEEQLAEDQAAVYKGLTEQDRQTISEIEDLRQEVKKEARDLETQLNDLVHNYDDTLKLKMYRLLHEQSQLCSQLRVTPQTETRSPLDPGRTVRSETH